MKRKTLFTLYLGLFLCCTLCPIQGHNLTSAAKASPLEPGTASYLYDFLQADFSLSTEFNVEARLEYDHFIQKMERQQSRYKSSKDFLRFVYYKVHNKFLRRYHTPANFSELFQKGGYDCLTGTALYAMIFHDLGYTFEITETTYHIYLTVYADGAPILIESTNPLEGFMDDPQTIRLMTEAYKLGNVRSNVSEYQFKQSIYQTINLYQLSGLHHYNLALEAYNNKHLTQALKHMEQALKRYPSKRLHEVLDVMISTLQGEAHIDPQEKHYYLDLYDQSLFRCIQGAIDQTDYYHFLNFMHS